MSLRSWALLILWLGQALLAAPDASARPRRVRVRVVDVSGDRAWLEPGSEAGLRRGDVVQIGRRRYEVVDTTASYGVIESRAGLALGARGVARVDIDRTDGVVEPLATPTPLSEFDGAWPDPVHPADAQDPDPIPLGLVAEDRRLIIRLQASGGALIPLGERGTTLGRGVLRARVHAEPFSDLPFAVDADAAVQMFFARNVANRRGARSQSLLRFRQLQLSYGTDESFYGAIGRLRYAAQSVGMLDGLRVRTESFGPFTFGAFGGFVPDARDGRPAFDAARFGVEASARDLNAPLRPMASVVALGSVFDGSMDERRLLVQAQLLPGRSRVGGHFEMQLFDEDNPFGASNGGGHRRRGGRGRPIRSHQSRSAPRLPKTRSFAMALLPAAGGVLLRSRRGNLRCGLRGTHSRCG